MQIEVLENIYWVFDETSYNSYSEFDKAITQYQLEIAGKDACWNPGLVVVNNPTVEISYEFYERDNDIQFEDETELLFEGEMVQGDEEEEGIKKIVKAKFFADNKQHFSALELLFKIHQRLLVRDLGDDIFFEGLASFDNSEKFDPPLFFVVFGS